MKTKLIISALALASSAHATLIDLTPGGFNINQPWPQPVLQFFNHVGRNGVQYLAGANIDGGRVVWSPFTIFGSDNLGIVLQDPANAQVSWNLTNTGGYFLQYVLLEGVNGIDNLYGLRERGFQFEGGGPVTIDGVTAIQVTAIQSITFAGTNIVADSGASLLLFACAAAVLIFSHHFRQFCKVRRRKSA
jgi:hypothetical protein